MNRRVLFSCPCTAMISRHILNTQITTRQRHSSSLQTSLWTRLKQLGWIRPMLTTILNTTINFLQTRLRQNPLLPIFRGNGVRLRRRWELLQSALMFISHFHTIPAILRFPHRVQPALSASRCNTLQPLLLLLLVLTGCIQKTHHQCSSSKWPIFR